MKKLVLLLFLGLNYLFSYELPDSLKTALENTGRSDSLLTEYALKNYRQERDNSLAIAQDILRKNSDDSLAQAHAYTILGLNAWEKDAQQALAFFEKALSFYNTAKDKQNAAKIMSYIGTIYKNSGHDKEALEIFVKSVDLYQSQSEQNQQKFASEVQNLRKIGSRRAFERNLILVITAIISLIFLLNYFLYLSTKQEILLRKKNEEEIIKLNKSLANRVQEEVEKYKKQQEFLNRKSKLEALGTLVAGIAHEINQPLGQMAIGIDNILFKLHKHSEINHDYIEAKCDSFLENIDRSQAIIRQIKSYSNAKNEDVPQIVEVQKALFNALTLSQGEIRKIGTDLVLNIPEEPFYTFGYANKLEQVFLNLLTNAKDALAERGTDSSPQLIIELKKGKRLQIFIKDNGCGIPDAHKDKIFDPFFSTKTPDKGTGLGLSIVYGIIAEMQGEISCYQEDGFTAFKVDLPLKEQHA